MICKSTFFYKIILTLFFSIFIGEIVLVAQDSDGDTVADAIDLDHDNDGILNTAEGCAGAELDAIADGTNLTTGTNYTTAEGLLVSYTTTAPAADRVRFYDPGHADPTYHGPMIRFYNTASTYNLTQTFGTAVKNVSFKLTDIDQGEDFTVIVRDENGSIYDLTQGFLTIGTAVDATQVGNTITTVEDPSVGNPNGNLASADSAAMIFYFPGFVSSISIDYTSTSGTVRMTEASFCLVDTDGDGLYDYEDLDADGDGCFDAEEGAGAFTIYNSGVLNNGSLSGSVDGSGIPSLATASGQGAGDAQNATIQSCSCPSGDQDLDGICDGDDIDADNDGIPNTLEFGSCTSGLTNILASDDFGTGGRTTSSYTNYCYEDGTGGAACSAFPGNVNLNDGEYTVVQRPRPDAASFGSWTTQGDHTGDAGGRMLVVNAALAANEFYRRTVDVTPDLDVIVDLWVLNVILPGRNALLPDISISLETLGGTTIGTALTTGSIPEDDTWHNYILSINPGNNTQVQVVLRNNGPGGSGNDLALDDILIKQVFCDTDNDGIADYLDLDSDNDGVADIVEAGGFDTDGDGIVDSNTDTDGDGLADIYDTDNGGVDIANEDADNDGIPNYLDLDSDNDGIADVVEAGGTDVDGDGRIDNYTDTDNDGFNDLVDGDVGNDGTAENTAQVLIITGADSNSDGQPDNYPQGDFDSDGFLNIWDLDSDNDGIQDILEAYGTDADGNGRIDTYTDTDNDGFHDAVDGDVGNDGTAENTAQVLIVTGTDNNSDGQPDSYPNANADGDANPNYLDLDADNDGVTDVVEIASGATNTDSPTAGPLDGQIEDGTITDANNDGWSDLQNGAINIIDTDGDGIPDPYDIDADNDGVPDYLEAVCSTCPTFAVPSGSDANGNGVLDTYEGLDANNQTSGTNIGTTPNEDNNDGTAPVDYLDLDSDNDNSYDWAEAFDNGFGTATAGDGNAADEIIQMAAAYVSNGGSATHYPNTDTDGDGLPDWLDNLNGPSYDNTQAPPFLNASSAFWIDADNDGLVDLFDNDVNGAALGTLAPVPDNDASNDRDWRDANTAVNFPIEWLFFYAERKSIDNVLLSWATATELNNAGFDIERMHENESTFSVIGFVEGQGTSNQASYYSYTDNNNYQGLTYYRLRQIDFNGEFDNSEVRAVDNTKNKVLDISVFPNPTPDVLKVRFDLLEEESKVNFELRDVSGRLLFNSTEHVQAGDLIQLDVMKELPAGTYYFNVQIELSQSQLNFEIVKP